MPEFEGAAAELKDWGIKVKGVLCQNHFLTFLVLYSYLLPIVVLTLAARWGHEVVILRLILNCPPDGHHRRRKEEGALILIFNTSFPTNRFFFY